MRAGWYNAQVLERCQSGRLGRSRKPLWAMPTVGSNPTLSAERKVLWAYRLSIC